LIIKEYTLFFKSLLFESFIYITKEKFCSVCFNLFRRSTHTFGQLFEKIFRKHFIVVRLAKLCDTLATCDLKVTEMVRGSKMTFFNKIFRFCLLFRFNLKTESVLSLNVLDLYLVLRAF
jgi:hypothetical protein